MVSVLLEIPTPGFWGAARLPPTAKSVDCGTTCTPAKAPVLAQPVTSVPSPSRTNCRHGPNLATPHSEATASPSFRSGKDRSWTQTWSASSERQRTRVDSPRRGSPWPTPRAARPRSARDPCRRRLGCCEMMAAASRVLPGSFGGVWAGLRRPTSVRNPWLEQEVDFTTSVERLPVKLSRDSNVHLWAFVDVSEKSTFTSRVVFDTPVHAYLKCPKCVSGS